MRKSRLRGRQPGPIGELARVRAEREESGRVFSVTVARRELRKWLRGSEDGMRVEEAVGELLPVSRSGRWYVAVDMQGLRGQTRSSVRVEPRATAQPLPKYQSPSLRPLAEAMSDSSFDGHGSLDSISAKDYDVFVSYASEDKDEVVHPLVVALRSEGLSVWYDDFKLSIGDSLRRRIDAGISHSKFGVVVLSSHFFAKGWPNYELVGLVNLHVSGNQGILPIWHRLTKAEVIAQSPSLADKIARNTSDFSIEDIAKEIAQVIQR